MRFVTGANSLLGKIRVILVLIILILSIVTLALSVVYGKHLYDAPLDPEKFNYPDSHRWSTA